MCIWGCGAGSMHHQGAEDMPQPPLVWCVVQLNRKQCYSPSMHPLKRRAAQRLLIPPAPALLAAALSAGRDLPRRVQRAGQQDLERPRGIPQVGAAATVGCTQPGRTPCRRMRAASGSLTGQGQPGARCPRHTGAAMHASWARNLHQLIRLPVLFLPVLSLNTHGGTHTHTHTPPGTPPQV